MWSVSVFFSFFKEILFFLNRGAWVAQSVVPDFGSGHDLTVHGFEPRVRLCADGSDLEPALDSVSPSLSAPLLLVLALSLSLSLSLKNK